MSQWVLNYNNNSSSYQTEIWPYILRSQGCHYHYDGNHLHLYNKHYHHRYMCQARPSKMDIIQPSKMGIIQLTITNEVMQIHACIDDLRLRRRLIVCAASIMRQFIFKTTTAFLMTFCTHEWRWLDFSACSVVVPLGNIGSSSFTFTLFFLLRPHKGVTRGSSSPSRPKSKFSSMMILD